MTPQDSDWTDAEKAIAYRMMSKYWTTFRYQPLETFAEFVEIQGFTESRIMELETMIAASSMYSYLYAFSILRRRFKAGEFAISQDSYSSFMYAKKVLKGRFELGEDAILDSKYAQKYTELIYQDALWVTEGF